MTCPNDILNDGIMIIFIDRNCQFIPPSELDVSVSMGTRFFPLYELKVESTYATTYGPHEFYPACLCAHLD